MVVERCLKKAMRNEAKKRKIDGQIVGLRAESLDSLHFLSAESLLFSRSKNHLNFRISKSRHAARIARA
jgi:hypothetical protein